MPTLIIGETLPNEKWAELNVPMLSYKAGGGKHAQAAMERLNLYKPLSE